MVDFEDPIKGSETWVLTDSGAIRLDDYHKLKGGGIYEFSSVVGRDVKKSSLFLNDFVIISELGRGAGGTVMKALHKSTLTLVAIKKLPMTSAAKRASARSELRVLYSQLADLQTPTTFTLGRDDEFQSENIVSFFDAFSTENGYIHVVMEYMNGGSLAGVVSKGSCLNMAVLANVARGVTKALAFLHEKKMIHRDVKPANVLLSVDGAVKLTDFGVSRDLASGSNKAETFVGTFSYMSPERIRGDDYDSSADVWGLGMTLLAIALGRFPIELNGKDAYWTIYDSIVTQGMKCTDKRNHLIRQLEGLGCSPRFLDFLDCCLATDPHDRWSAKMLLTHPFVKVGEVTVPNAEHRGVITSNYGSVSGAATNTFVDTKEQEMLIEAREVELKEIVAVCNQNHVRYRRKKDFEGRNLHLRLAKQLGLPPEVVQDTFCQRRKEPEIGRAKSSSFFMKIMETGSSLLSPTKASTKKSNFFNSDGKTEGSGNNRARAQSEGGETSHQFSKFTS
jgi:serine/threonine protein kinase